MHAMKLGGCVRCLLVGLVGMVITAADMIPSFDKEPESAIVKQRGNVTLTCEVQPASAAVRWTFQGAPLSAESDSYEITAHNLTIRSFARDKHEGVYRCIAETSAGSIISRPAVVTKSVFRQFPKEAIDETVEIVEGETAIIPCHAPVSLPPAALTFQRNGAVVREDARHRIMPSSGTMQVEGIQRGEAGTYRCVATNPVNGQERSSPGQVTLIVKDPYLKPTQPRILNNVVEKIEVAQGGDVMLECVARGSPPMKYLWSKYGGILPSGKTETFLGNLRVRNLMVWDQGTYMCTVSNGIGDAEQPIRKIYKILVRVQPVLVISNPNKVVRVDDPVEIKCTFNAVNKQPDNELDDALREPILWYHNATSVFNGRHIKIRRNVLSIERVQQWHAGLYQCATSSAQGYASARARIEISYGVHTNLTTHGDIINTRIGHAVSLPCPSSKPVIWVINGKTTPSTNAKISPNGTFSLATARFADAGKYKCLEKKGERLLKSYRLTVQAGDRYGQSDSSKVGDNRTTINPDDENAKGDKSRRKKKNKHKKTEAFLVPPSKPVVTKLSDTSVMLGWTVPTNDGLKITFFRIQYKEVWPERGQWQTQDSEIDKTKRKFEVSHLNPGNKYKFRIAAVFTNNDHKFGPTSDRFHLSQELAPELRAPRTVPTLVKVEPFIHDGVHAMKIQWQFLPTEQAHIIGFNLEYKPHYLDVVYSKITFEQRGMRAFVLKQLQPDTSYDFRLNCFNSAGPSSYSNKVVKHTLGPNHDQFKPPILVKGHEDVATTRQTTAKSSVAYETKNSTQQSNEMLYMVLGIVLGILMLLLVIFMVMCGIRQRQNRRMANDLIATKYQDPAQRIYADNVDKYKNGGSFFLSHLNGAPNGHVPNATQMNGNRGVNVAVNPLTEYDTQTQILQSESELLTPHALTPGVNQRASDGTYNSIDGSHGSHGSHTYTSAPTYSVLSPQPPMPPLSSFALSHRPIEPAPPPAPTHRSTPSSSASPSYSGGPYAQTPTPYAQTATPYAQTATPYAQSAVAHNFPEYDSDDSREFRSLVRRKNNNDGWVTEPPVYPPPATPPGARHNRRPPRPKQPTGPSHHGDVAATMNLMKDQATNTDISSSNEGTIDDSSLSRLHDYDSPGSSLPRRRPGNHGDERLSPPRYCVRDSSDMEYRMLPQSQMLQYQYDSDAMTDT